VQHECRHAHAAVMSLRLTNGEAFVKNAGPAG
jgi:hypothetical protein